MHSLSSRRKRRMQTLKINDVILKTVVRMVVFIILTLGMYLFFAGHNAPGGGFIGGLVLGSAIVLLYLTYDIETVHRGMPFDFKLVAAIGVLLATGTAIASLFFDKERGCRFNYFFLSILFLLCTDTQNYTIFLNQ